MNYEPTKRVLSDGRRIYACPTCGSDVPAAEGQPLPQHNCGGVWLGPKRLADVPCDHRRIPHSRVQDPSCGNCKIDVYHCAVHAFATVNQITVTVNNIIPKACANCGDRRTSEV